MAAALFSNRQNTGSVAASGHTSVMTPSPPTPRPNTAPDAEPKQKADDASTPTRATFKSPAHGQKPLPKDAFPQAVQIPEAADNSKSDSPHRTPQSQARDSMEMDIDESDGEGEAGDDVGSDDDSVSADGTRSSKKKKSQRFYCTDFPPCSLSFTRSEHLARHIRKHTGERPFQCHCSRRFSRLDNLRQHAQTVHVNEDIPIDSLAATGSRFQRQIRTDRVRAAGNRARASTGGSAGGPARGHSKSLSTSSINSISSVGSGYSAHPDARRRPPSLVMAADPRARGAMDPYRGDGGYYGPPSPEYGTPTSATFSTGQTSPRWNPDLASPNISHSRSHSMYSAGARTPGRRLSVPSGANPFQSPHGGPLGRPVFAPGPVNTSNNGAFSPPGSGLISSPTMSNSGWGGRRDSVSSVSDDPWRRRTWHPDSRGFGGNPSQLSAVHSHNVPDPPPPMAEPTKPQPGLRLPGIESFGPIPGPPRTPPRGPSPMKVDSEPRMRMPAGLEASPADRPRNANLYEPNLQRGLNRLELEHHSSRDSPGAWASEVTKAVQDQADQVRMNPTVRFQEPPPSAYHNGPAMASRSLHQQTMSAPSLASMRDNRRHGWYHGPARESHATQQQPPTDPRAAHVDRMEHPNMTAFSGFPGREQQPPPPPPERNNNGDPLGRLEALVAVATSEGSTATAY